MACEQISQPLICQGHKTESANGFMDNHSVPAGSSADSGNTLFNLAPKKVWNKATYMGEVSQELPGWARTQLMACVWAWKEEESWEMLIVWGNEIQQRLLNAPSEVSAARAGGPASKPRHWKEKTSCLAFALHSLFHLQIAPIYICPRNHLTLPQTERDFEWVLVLCWNTKLEKITGNSRAKTVSKKHRAKSALCS